MPCAQAQPGGGAVLLITTVSAQFLIVAGVVLCPNEPATP